MRVEFWMKVCLDRSALKSVKDPSARYLQTDYRHDCIDDTTEIRLAEKPKIKEQKGHFDEELHKEVIEFFGEKVLDGVLAIKLADMARYPAYCFQFEYIRTGDFSHVSRIVRSVQCVVSPSGLIHTFQLHNESSNT